MFTLHNMDKHKELVIIGRKIRQLREGAGFAQEAFAYHISLGRAFYGRLERGEQAPGSLVLIKIAKALNIEVGELFPSLKELRACSKPRDLLQK